MAICIIQFTIVGKGTISPADKTKQLVLNGLYVYSRNPMYVGVLLILLGLSVSLSSIAILLYTIVVLILFNLYIHFFEEPRLKRDFGQDYINYSKKVRRWI